MASCLTSLSQSQNGNNNNAAENYLENLLESARPFLRGEYEKVDETLPSLIAVLRSKGTGETWHKDNNFLNHLIHIYKILKLWKLQDFICLCGLFHSSYLAIDGGLTIFGPSVERETVRSIVGESAEKLIHLYCSISGYKLIEQVLLAQYSDEELTEHLERSKLSLQKYVNGDSTTIVNGSDEAWRKKVQSVVPANGVYAKHLRTGEDVHVSRRIVGMLMIMKMADFSDQFFNFQDDLFNNFDGKLKFSGEDTDALWPGNCKPGLWVSSVSRVGALYTIVMREEEIYMLENKKTSKTAHNSNKNNNNNNNNHVVIERNEDIKLIMPPVFENCSKILNPEDQIRARDMYWEAVCIDKPNKEKAEGLLVKSIELNPFVGEPHVVLGQIYLSKGRFAEGEREAQKGLQLLLEWGGAWDKRICWEGWVSWTRVLLFNAKKKSWPNTSWGILFLGTIG